VTPAHQAAVRQAILAATKGRTPKEIAQRTTGPNGRPLCDRTVSRFLAGQTFGPTTAVVIAKALRVDLDNVHPQSGQERPEPDQNGQKRTELSPIMGWRQAALVLRVSDRHLRRVRRSARVARKPWWPSVEAVLEWFHELLLGSEVTA
jgi:hypothetical protein